MELRSCCLFSLDESWGGSMSLISTVFHFSASCGTFDVASRLGPLTHLLSINNPQGPLRMYVHESKAELIGHAIIFFEKQ